MHLKWTQLSQHSPGASSSLHLGPLAVLLFQHDILMRSSIYSFWGLRIYMLSITIPLSDKAISDIPEENGFFFSPKTSQPKATHYSLPDRIKWTFCKQTFCCSICQEQPRSGWECVQTLEMTKQHLRKVLQKSTGFLHWLQKSTGFLHCAALARR